MKEELKWYFKNSPEYEHLNEKQMQKCFLDIDQLFFKYQPERLNPEALYNEDGTLNNPPCPICGLGKWSSLHQGCDSPNPEYK